MQIRSILLNILQALTRTAIWSTTAAVLTATAFAQGQSIPIVNAGFEADVLGCAAGPLCYDSFMVPGWSVSGEVATFKPSAGPGGEFPGGVPGGSNVAALGDSIGSGVISQDLGFAPLPNTRYTVTVYVGQRTDYPLLTYAVELVVGTTSVASDVTLKPPPGTFALDTVTYNSGSFLGTGDLIIRLTGGGPGGQAEFAQVALTATSVGPTTQVLPQLAFGGGWYSALYFTNSNVGAVSFPVSFTSDNGTPLTVPSIGGSSTTVNLGPQGTAILEAPNVGTLSQGYVTAALPTGVTGYGVFRQTVPGVPDQEAVVPLANVSSTGSTLIYDDTAYVTGVAIANPSALPVTVSVTVWNNFGTVIGTSSIFLAAGTKTEAALRNISGLSAVAGNRGTARFTVASGSVAVLGLRFDGTAFTSIPTVQQ